MEKFLFSLLLASAVLLVVFPDGPIHWLFLAIVIIIAFILLWLNNLAKDNSDKNDEPEKADFNVDEAKASSSYDPETKLYSLFVDYVEDIEILTHKYRSCDPNINSDNFPTSSSLVGKKEKITIKVFEYNREMEPDNVIIDMNKKGFRPILAVENLEFGLVFSSLQRPVLALGSLNKSISSGNPLFTYLKVNNGDQVVVLGKYEREWPENTLYLGVKI